MEYISIAVGKNHIIDSDIQTNCLWIFWRAKTLSKEGARQILLCATKQRAWRLIFCRSDPSRLFPFLRPQGNTSWKEFEQLWTNDSQEWDLIWKQKITCPSFRRYKCVKTEIFQVFRDRIIFYSYFRWFNLSCIIVDTKFGDLLALIFAINKAEYILYKLT